ncbi:hypothetical protein KY308_01595 [Candidatus Woesearchaeota archaeon]|nr:hypothetical protein [Candidatus Woesearchaeota archaeon]
MPKFISPNEFRSFIISNFRLFVNCSTVDGRREVAKRIIDECEKIDKEEIKIAPSPSPLLKEALDFVVVDFAENTDVMNLSIQKNIMRFLDRLL